MKLINFKSYFVFLICTFNFFQSSYCDPLEDDKPQENKKTEDGENQINKKHSPTLFKPSPGHGFMATESRSSNILSSSNISGNLRNNYKSIPLSTLPVISNEQQKKEQSDVIEKIFFQAMHKDILKIILSYLSPHDILHLLSSCKTLNKKWEFVEALDSKNTRVPLAFVQQMRKHCKDI